MKTLILSPKFFPIEDGLSQYTYQFYQELQKTEDVSVLTSKKIGNEDVYSEIEDWGIKGIGKINKAVQRINPDTILIQYVPFMYSVRGGINFSIVSLFLYWRIFKKFKIHIMYHEVNYPLQGNLKALLMWISHHIMLLVGGLAAHRIFTSTLYFKNKINRFFLGMKRVIHLPVGSNISPCPISTEEQKALRERFPCEVLLGCFGSFHPSKDYTGVLQSLVELDRDIKLLFIGATIEQIIVEYPSVDAQKLTERVYAVGFLNNKETFEHLNILDGFVGYFSDGVSTRRGSIIAAIDLAIPIFTSKSERTEQVFGELEFVFLHSNQQNEFKSQLLKTLQNFDFNRESSFETSKKLAREFFSWKSIISLYRQNS